MNLVFYLEKKKTKCKMKLSELPQHTHTIQVHSLRLTHLYTHLNSWPKQRMSLVMHEDLCSSLIAFAALVLFFFSMFIQRDIFSLPSSHGSDHNSVFGLCFKDNSKNN